MSMTQGEYWACWVKVDCTGVSTCLPACIQSWTKVAFLSCVLLCRFWEYGHGVCWSELCDELEVIDVPGDHFSLLRQDEQVRCMSMIAPCITLQRRTLLQSMMTAQDNKASVPLLEMHCRT